LKIIKQKNELTLLDSQNIYIWRPNNKLFEE
jgi:hypothetical protein